MGEVHEVMSEEQKSAPSLIVTRREPKTKEERNSYWYKAYKSVEEAAQNAQRRIEDLEKLLRMQIKTNDIIGQSMADSSKLQNQELNAHGKEMQEMGKELIRLRAKVRELGGHIDD